LHRKVSDHPKVVKNPLLSLSNAKTDADVKTSRKKDAEGKEVVVFNPLLSPGQKGNDVLPQKGNSEMDSTQNEENREGLTDESKDPNKLFQSSFPVRKRTQTYSSSNENEYVSLSHAYTLFLSLSSLPI
jgi:hypothetical protein